MQNVAVINCTEIVYLPVDRIRPNPYQPRRNFDKTPLEELAKSIEQYGVMQPISVRFINGTSYELVAGERRLKACKIAGIKFIPSIIVNINDRDSAAISLIENIQKEDLNFIEEAEGYRNLMLDYNYTIEELAKIVGKSETFISQKLRILRISKRVQRILVENGVSERHARALLKIEDADLQKDIVDKVIKYNLGIKRTEELIESTLKKKEEEIEQKNNKMKIKTYFKDVRIFTNTIKQAVDIMNESGVLTDYNINKDDDTYEISIKIKCN